MSEEFDAVVVGGGHNGLVASAYLAKAGLRVALLERNDHLGGATQSSIAFQGVPARLSRYSYLIALFPDQIRRDLGLRFETLSRTVSSYTPWADSGVLINRDFDEQSRASINQLAGNASESANWLAFYERIARFAAAIAPTLLHPMPSAEQARELVGEDLWQEFVVDPLSVTLERNFSSDLIRGIVLTDGLIGTYTSATERAANICFLYHLIGNGTGEWRVPKGGMGALVAELTKVAISSGAVIRNSSEVTSLQQVDGSVSIKTADGGVIEAKVALATCSPTTLERISGIKAPPFRPGSQLKINMVLAKLPRLRSGVDPVRAFAGTFHINESYSLLERAFAQSSAGEIPSVIPAEMYCHTLTDPSILDPALAEAGFHTLTLFAIHTPASLFDRDHDRIKEEVTQRILAGLNTYLVDPIESCLATDSAGRVCIEVKTPQELEREIDLPRGNIFHSDLQFPWQEAGDRRRWGVETEFDRIFLAGSGARRGGAVSGIPGHNGARAALERLGR